MSLESFMINRNMSTIYVSEKISTRKTCSFSSLNIFNKNVMANTQNGDGENVLGVNLPQFYTFL